MTEKQTPARVAVVTGGSRGIGFASARLLAADGHAVVICSRNQGESDTAAKEIIADGGTAMGVHGDVSDEASVGALFDTAEAAYGGVDVVVHAAAHAGLGRTSTVADLDLNVLDELYRTNIRGTFMVAQQAARRVRDGGAIVTFSSAVVALSMPGYASYSASKGAVEALTLILARELGTRDITVNAVAPGPTATELFLEGKDDRTLSELAARAPVGRLGTPEEIAEVVAFLARPAGHWINGQVLQVNGGVL
ncbi:3-oxoacyl-ACP reductase [Catellatospora methionotrophica]|uniref:3-oxoacyl-ACP reductase n=1 Tax=Catellatospora methionotrophica TaxID=121620 RepID=A0A8J3L5E1_9ACTN|nr:SDR family oxidoreductase [Catellatospora methionotrophica]GIG12103.1 3-oxoacyl-ACP reductase [Catellatospora methionotrophica]